MKTHNTHSNSDLIKTDFSEGIMLREAIAFRSTTNWRSFNKKEQFVDAKSKREFIEARREANLKFQNETVVRYKAA